MYKHHISSLKSAGRHRKLVDQLKTQVDFSSNDYLCLSQNSEVINAAAAAAVKYGVGSTGSRLLSGNKVIFTELESKIATDIKTEAAMIYSSGFVANFSTLSALLNDKILKEKPIVFCDKLNHASIYEAIKASNVELIRYQHCSIESLTKSLEKYKHDTRPKFIITETVFGMNGDVAPLAEIIDLACKYSAFIYLDEAHAIGVFGKSGYGLAPDLDFSNLDYVVMGTFSKAVGTSGAFIGCSEEMKEYLVNTSLGFIYSTAPSPMVVGASMKAWELIKDKHQERAALIAMAQDLIEQIQELGFDTLGSESHIIPILLKDESRAIDAAQKLRSKGIIVSCIRPPSVPPGSSRLRIALNTSHTKEHVSYLIESLKCI